MGVSKTVVENAKSDHADRPFALHRVKKSDGSTSRNPFEYGIGLIRSL